MAAFSSTFAVVAAPFFRKESSVSSSRSASPAQACLSASSFIAPRVTLANRRPIGVSARKSKFQVQAVASTKLNAVKYSLPDWNAFELGTSPVYWEPASPAAGQTMTIWFNPELTVLRQSEYIAFNGGFNGPFMCGGAPRGMAKKARGGGEPLWSIRVNVPKHAGFLNFGFTDGKDWDEGYEVQVTPFKGFEGRPKEFFQEGLAKEMGYEGACEAAIFPDEVPEAVYCKMPSPMLGQSCELDVVTGCTDPEAPNYDPMATMDDSSCDIPKPEQLAK
mmetsp:Transcript_9901/g.18608  ORF Transcript_9901/g.18608 Transcript_9901/m.18608 type:complete len:276 (-) Transcript_9901:336-1163(-)|eukprot:CAMPEP_0114250982 /NCGR_PEP_ID=MMETSP0058-20121206/15009_1 /TAXON_ID=36894 /ORGANISM="Pyramimonas parkeae, CCMP726" /LENGTH=275 /DNA_ID=CAMNT_0001364717 /DNA_START=84 /DNA_END=911 /DNA_ORIENTATION=-